MNINFNSSNQYQQRPAFGMLHANEIGTKCLLRNAGKEGIESFKEIIKRQNDFIYSDIFLQGNGDVLIKSNEADGKEFTIGKDFKESLIATELRPKLDEIRDFFGISTKDDIILTNITYHGGYFKDYRLPIADTLAELLEKAAQLRADLTNKTAKDMDEIKALLGGFTD